MTRLALFRVWSHGRVCGDIELGVRACDGGNAGGNSDSIGDHAAFVELPTCPDCAVLRDYAEENASVT